MFRSLIAFLLLLVLAAPAAAASYGNRTNLTFDPGHGTQVEYVAADGTNYLWYPGNQVVLPGHWQVNPATICFAYGANTYNPVTGQHGAGWECERKADYASFIVDHMSGDVFNLRHREGVPFPLPRTRATLAALLKQVGGAAPAADMPALAPSAMVTGGVTPAQILSRGDPSLQFYRAPANGRSCTPLANDQSNAAMMGAAARMYYFGYDDGRLCTNVDYVRAFALMRASHDTADFNTLLSDLRYKAKHGNKAAIAALKQIDPSPVR